MRSHSISGGKTRSTADADDIFENATGFIYTKRLWLRRSTLILILVYIKMYWTHLSPTRQSLSLPQVHGVGVPLICMLCLQVMKENNVKNMVFSSSATVYGDPQYLPLDEKHPVGGCTNPYGKTKYFIEEILSDVCKADKVSNSERFIWQEFYQTKRI